MAVRIEDLKVGIKVKLVDTIPWGMIVHPIMKEYLGSVCTIKTINIINDYFEIQEDQQEFYDGGFYWNIVFIEKIVEGKEKKNKVYINLEEIEKQSSLKEWNEFNIGYFYHTAPDFKFKKCIVNNNCIIGLFEIGKQIYKGIAKCHPGDKFNLAKGLTIAMFRAYRDWLDKEIKNLYY